MLIFMSAWSRNNRNPCTDPGSCGGCRRGRCCDPLRFCGPTSAPRPLRQGQLAEPSKRGRTARLPAQLDTAADRTVLPAALVSTLNLPQVGVMAFGGFGG